MHVSDGIAKLRVRHALASERIDELGSNPPTHTMPGADNHNDRPSADGEDNARDLWDVKLVQIHSAALLHGPELYPSTTTDVAAAAGSPRPHPPTDAATRGLAHQPS
jgi:hypothetical protein